MVSQRHCWRRAKMVCWTDWPSDNLCLLPIQEYMNTLISSQTWRDTKGGKNKKNLMIGLCHCIYFLWSAKQCSLIQSRLQKTQQSELDDGSHVVKVVKTGSLPDSKGTLSFYLQVGSWESLQKKGFLPDLKETLSFHLQVGSWGSWLGVVQLIDRPVPPLCFYTLLPIPCAIALYHDQVAGIGLAVWGRSQPKEIWHSKITKFFSGILEFGSTLLRDSNF